MKFHFGNKIVGAVLLCLMALLAGCSNSSSDSGSPPPSSAILVAFLTQLSGAQENPPVLTAAAGNANFVVDVNSGQITGDVITSDVTANAAHIHTGDAGINGPVIIGLTQAVAGSGIWAVPPNTTLTAAQLTALRAGGLYANVHSDLYPGGQIRGQIGRPTFTTQMAGSQENPPVITTATGTGVFSIDLQTRALSGRVITSGLTATAAHIHTGAIGVNGPVAVGFVETEPGSGIWVPPVNTILSTEQFQSFLAGGIYFNLHSAAFPGGEIRGQIGRDVFDVVLTGAQENPPVAGGGSATSRIVVNPATREVSGSVTNIGIAATAGHIHTGLFGVNGPVLVPTTVSAAGSAVWNFTPATFTVAQYRAFLFGNMYANTHSAAFPGGEARGQIGKVTRTGLLSGANEVPPTTTTAAGRGRAELDPNTLGVFVTITTTGMTATAAHLHLGAVGANGPVIVPLTQGPTNTWTSAAGMKLTQAQAVAFAAGGIYFNAHSAALPGGEVRGQAAGLD